MELGNLLFGNSRGQYEVERDAGWEEELIRLFDAIDPDRDNSWREYGVEYENDTFWTMPYWWGNCTCGQGKGIDESEHKPDCKLVRDNFHYKPTGFGIQWYKYPLRDAYMNQDISLADFRKMIDDCIASLKRETANNGGKQ